MRRLRADERGVKRRFLERGAGRHGGPLGRKSARIQTHRLPLITTSEEINRHVYRDGMNPGRKLCRASETG